MEISWSGIEGTESEPQLWQYQILKPTVLGWGSNLCLCSYPSHCSWVLNLLHHSGNSWMSFLPDVLLTTPGGWKSYSGVWKQILVASHIHSASGSRKTHLGVPSPASLPPGKSGVSMLTSFSLPFFSAPTPLDDLWNFQHPWLHEGRTLGHVVHSSIPCAWKGTWCIMGAQEILAK